MKLILKLISACILLIMVSNTSIAQDLNKILKLFEGSYELMSWKQDDKTYKFPKVKGTFVSYDNKIAFTLDNHMKENKTVKIIGWGNYSLSADKFSYKYFDFKRITFKNNDVDVNLALPWKDNRDYQVTLKNNELIFISKQGKQKWVLNDKSLIYSDKEWGVEKKKVIRVWKRIN